MFRVEFSGMTDNPNAHVPAVSDHRGPMSSLEGPNIL